MNERIKELAEQAGFNLGRFDVGSASLLSQRIERFAELVRQDEREACAKLLESVDNPLAKLLAESIRGRTE
jgi:hypothetical protein